VEGHTAPLHSLASPRAGPAADGASRLWRPLRACFGQVR